MRLQLLASEAYRGNCDWSLLAGEKEVSAKKRCMYLVTVRQGGRTEISLLWGASGWK